MVRVYILLFFSHKTSIWCFKPTKMVIIHVLLGLWLSFVRINHWWWLRIMRQENLLWSSTHIINWHHWLPYWLRLLMECLNIVSSCKHHIWIDSLFLLCCLSFSWFLVVLNLNFLYWVILIHLNCFSNRIAMDRFPCWRLFLNLLSWYDSLDLCFFFCFIVIVACWSFKLASDGILYLSTDIFFNTQALLSQIL